jgi:tetratricopeptide (TPR) repeat protein
MRTNMLRLIVIIILTYSVVEATDWTSYNKSGISFIYPSEWGSRESWAGTVLGDNQTFALSIAMHREGCYSLSQHPLLMDLMLKMWGGQMRGKPEGNPITQAYENDIGPYSVASQIYKDPNQVLTCELQGYSAKNVTVTFALANWKPEDLQWSENVLKLAKLRASFKVSIPDTKAIQASERPIELNPKYAVSWFEKGNTLYDQGKYNESIQAYDKAIKLNQQYAAAWNNKGNALDAQGKFDEAIKAYDKAIDLNPKYAAAWSNKGNALANKCKYPLYYNASFQGKCNESIQAYDKAIELDPNLTEAWYNKGQTLNSQGKYNEAIKAYDKAIKIDPYLAVAWNKKGFALNDLGKYDEAIQAFDKAIELEPNLVLALGGKITALKALGRTSEADATLSKVREMSASSKNSDLVVKRQY